MGVEEQLTGWVGESRPRGWDVLAALPPLPGRVCLICDAPAIVGTVDGWRCGDHPPRWGQTLDWTPRGRPCVGSRCYCGRCDTYEIGRFGSSMTPGKTDLKKSRQAGLAEAGSGPRRRFERPDTLPDNVRPLRARPATGAGHPATSHAAADALHGLPIGRIRLDVFRAIRHRGANGMTDDELEVSLGRPHQTVSSARNALVQQGYVEAGVTRGGLPASRVTRSGHRATVWVATAATAALPR